MTATRRLPRPRTGVYDWQLQAACRTISSDLFFSPAEERGRARQHRDEQAKALCATCAVRTECLQHALAVAEPYGVWGGLTPEERQHHQQSRSHQA